MTALNVRFSYLGHPMMLWVDYCCSFGNSSNASGSSDPGAGGMVGQFG